MSVSLNISINMDSVTLQALRNGIADRANLHKAVAGDAEILYKDYVSKLNRHKTANQLGANPTKHHEKAAARIESGYDRDAATIRIPADTGLGRAFRDITLKPGSGKTYLTIPAHATTYGVPARLVPHDMRFAIVGGRHSALMFTSGPDAGSVAYWLRRSVTQKRDATLLPDEEAIQKIASAAARNYIDTIQKRRALT
jgi:hypothetical protein